MSHQPQSRDTIAAVGRSGIVNDRNRFGCYDHLFILNARRGKRHLIVT
jgi:hypothetical protein